MAVRSVGFQEEEILPVAESLKETGQYINMDAYKSFRSNDTWDENSYS